MNSREKENFPFDHMVRWIKEKQIKKERERKVATGYVKYNNNGVEQFDGKRRKWNQEKWSVHKLARRDLEAVRRGGRARVVRAVENGRPARVFRRHSQPDAAALSVAPRWTGRRMRRTLPLAQTARTRTPSWFGITTIPRLATKPYTKVYKRIFK